MGVPSQPAFQRQLLLETSTTRSPGRYTLLHLGPFPADPQISSIARGPAGPPPRCAADPLHAWLAPDSRSLPRPELRQLWEDDAWQRLWDTLDRGFGGLPVGHATQPVVLRGKPGTVLTGLARQPGDLLVIGAGRRGPLRQRLGGGVSRYCLANAHCPVLAIPPPALAQHVSHGLRRWVWRHHLHLNTAQTT